MHIEPSAFFFEPDGRSIPNNRMLPVLIYNQVLDTKASSKANRFEETFIRNGWTGCWRWGVYNFQHFHSNAHEALGVALGKATLQLGGAQGKVFDVSAGDLIVLPAGTGHKNLACSHDFLVVGAYPYGQAQYDTSKGDPTKYSKAIETIATTPKPNTDPFYGKQGPLIDLWNARTRSL